MTASAGDSLALEKGSDTAIHGDYCAYYIVSWVLNSFIHFAAFPQGLLAGVRPYL